MRKAENKTIPLVAQATLVKSGVVQVGAGLELRPVVTKRQRPVTR